MNTSTRDSTPISLRRELKKRFGSKSFWLKEGLSILAGIKLPSLALGGINTYRKQSDPTVRSIALVASNPEAEFVLQTAAHSTTAANVTARPTTKATFSQTRISAAIRVSLRRLKWNGPSVSSVSSSSTGFS
jgi:hypothetical protein